MQPVVNRQQAARMRNDRIEQLTQALSIASKVKSSDPIRKSQLPTVEEEGIGIYSFKETANYGGVKLRSLSREEQSAIATSPMHTSQA